MFDYTKSYFYYADGNRVFSYDELKADFLQNADADQVEEGFDAWLDLATDFGGELTICRTEEEARAYLFCDEEEDY